MPEPVSPPPTVIQWLIKLEANTILWSRRLLIRFIKLHIDVVVTRIQFWVRASFLRIALFLDPILGMGLFPHNSHPLLYSLLSTACLLIIAPPPPPLDPIMGTGLFPYKSPPPSWTQFWVQACLLIIPPLDPIMGTGLFPYNSPSPPP